MTYYEKCLNGYVSTPINNPVIFLGKPVGLLLDPGHGTREYTKGKHNCDGSIYEGEWAREMAARMLPGFRALGIDARCLVPEDEDIKVDTRAKRANTIMANEPDKYWLYLAIHLNAVSGGEYAWKPGATGFVAYAAKNASVFACNWAKECVSEARGMGLGGNRSIPAEGFKRENWTVVYKTKMPAILVEHGFMTDQQEAAWLISEKGKTTLDNLHTAVFCDIFKIPYAHIRG